MKHYLLIALFFTVCPSLYAQNIININIEGNLFKVSVNNTQMTAEIHDEDYMIDDVKYPQRVYSRKINGFIGNAKARTLEIPSHINIDGKEYTLTRIGNKAFAGFTNLYKVIIPTTVTTIGDYAFYGTPLEKVEIPSSVTRIGKRAFGRCSRLHTLILPSKDIVLGTDICAESKKIKLEYSTTIGVAPVPKPEPKPVITTSDVDENLPVSSKQNDEMFAIIIANENYMNVAHVDCALNDGRTFRRYCQQVLGIPEDNIHIIEDATYGQMTEQVNWLSRVAKAYEGDARIVIYYAGHGIPNEKDGSAYLLPIDASGDNTAAAYSLNKLYAELGALNAKSVTLFMDACFSGSRRGDGMLTAARGVAIASKQEAPLGNMVVFSAAQGDETAYPYAEKGHGLFTYFLLKKLKDSKGNVDYGTLGEYIRQQVSRKSVVVNSKPQTPTVSYAPQMSKTWKSMTLK